MPRFHPLDPDFVAHVRAGGGDAHGQPAERTAWNGPGLPCRHCLSEVPEGEDYLILAARPFPAPQPYAETGPIFLCAHDCAAWSGAGTPPVLTTAPDYLVKGYGADHRIVYGTGRITPNAELAAYAGTLLTRKGIAFVDIRSARNNCFLARATA